LYYSIGLWAFSAVRIVTATFFAMQDTRTPVKMAVISIGVNIILGMILMRPLSHSGLALATSIASIMNLGLLIRALRTKLGSLGWRNIARSFGRTLFCSIGMGITVWATARFLVPAESRTLTGLLGGVAGSIAAGLIIYGAISFLVKSPELSSVLAEAGKGIVKK
jgi:putative peptidoglycan lipid II flippase